MSIKKVYRALIIARQPPELRESSLHCNLLIEKLNTNLLIVRIAIIRRLNTIVLDKK
jgi:hypothetical protein